MGIDQTKPVPEIYGSIYNTGTDTAKDIFFTYKESAVPIKLFPRISSRETRNFRFQFPDLSKMTKDKKGVHALAFLLNYKDLNNYSFSAPVIKTHTIGKKSVKLPIQIIRNNKVLILKGKIKEQLKLKNLSDDVIDLSLRGVSSAEIEFYVPKKIKLNPREIKTINLLIENNSGLLGSSYFLFFIAKRDQATEIQTQIITIQATIRKARPVSGKTELPLVLLALLLVSSLCIFIIERKSSFNVF